MSKRRSVVAVNVGKDPKTIKSEGDNEEIDWTRCFICQKDEAEHLQATSEAKTGDTEQPYRDLAKRILKFESIDLLPVSLDIRKLEQGESSLEDAFIRHRAKFHKSCKNKFGADKLERAIKKYEKQRQSEIGSRLRNSQSSNPKSSKKSKCFFCGEEESFEKGSLHLVQSYRLDNRVRTCASLLGDTNLYAKLQNGDMIAQDALYHKSCLTKLYKRASSKQFGDDTSEQQRRLSGIAFGEVVAFIEETMLESIETANIPTFKLSDLIKLYTANLAKLGVTLETREHSTRFKKRLLNQFEDLTAYNDGKEVILVFNQDVGEAISVAMEANYDDDGYILAKAANIIRRDILQSEHFHFHGDFKPGCQESSIPPALKSFMSYLLHSLTETPGNNEHYKQAVLTLCQLVTFNTLIRTRKESTSSYHSVNREPALCVYLAMMIHNKTRNLDMVETVSKLGLCISKHRLSNLSIAMGNKVIELNEFDRVVLPTSLMLGIFSTASIDNLDIAIKSALATTSFHGTAASINQHPKAIGQGSPRKALEFEKVKSETLRNLPTSYTDVPPFHLPSEVKPPAFQKSNVAKQDSVPDQTKDEKWLENPEQLSWAVYHSKEENPTTCKDISAMLPIFRDDSKSPATIKHLLNVLIHSINFLNPGQPAVIGLDQPLFALAKRIQWYQPSLYGEKKLVLMLGALHIEMVMLSCLGDWLEDSGWTTVVSSSGITSSGNDSLLTGHDVAQTKYVHQVTAMALYRLMQSAYDDRTPNNAKSFEVWRAEMEKENPQFKFWSIALKMEMDYLSFLRSIRSADFKLYVASLRKFLPWIFLFDHVHYARWLTIHHHDMEVLKDTNPQIYEEFVTNGNFVVNRTQNRFSSMGLDQRHEQLNKDVKGSGGLVGLTEDEDKFRRWQVCSPEVARAVSEFEEITVLKENEHSVYNHHEDSDAFKKKFRTDVGKLSTEITRLGNPFNSSSSDDSKELIQLGNKDVMNEETAKKVFEVEKIGKDQFEKFQATRISSQTTSIDSPITKNNIIIFKTSCTKGKSSKTETKELKMHLRLFSQMYIATQIRGGDLDEFFRHETLPYPPALAKGGQMRSGNKSDLAKCVQPAEVVSSPPEVDGAVLEGSVIVNMTKPKKNQRFQDYCRQSFYPQVKKLQNEYKSQRVDVVFDTYQNLSLKAATRTKRGKGIRRKVLDDSIAPTNWNGFLRLNQNKTELFAYLSKELMPCADDDTVLTCAYATTCITSSGQMASSFISPCNHEEADTRVFLHVNDMSLQGHTKITIRTVDTDVLVIAISVFARLHCQLEELWIDFGTGKHRQFFPIHLIVSDIGQSKALGIPFFHAFTGCDQVSYMSQVSKSSAWKIWNSFEEITPIFEKLSHKPTHRDVEEALPILERFTVLLYSKTSNCLSTNECRKELFCKGRSIDSIPPTSGALLQHAFRSSYISGYNWEQAIVTNQSLPDPEQWGFKMANNCYAPKWSDLPDATIASRQLIKCGCDPKKGCKGRCNCVSSDFLCTQLCKCKGECERD